MSPQVAEPTAVESNVATLVAPVVPAPAAANEATKAATNGAPKKVAKKAAATKKAPVKKAAKAPAAATPAKDKSGLRKPQERILKYLAKHSDKSFTRAQIAEKAEVDVAACVEYIGSHDDKKRIANDKKHFPSLVTLKLVKFGPQQEEGAAVSYQISATGKAKAAQLS